MAQKSQLFPSQRSMVAPRPHRQEYYEECPRAHPKVNQPPRHRIGEEPWLSRSSIKKKSKPFKKDKNINIHIQLAPLTVAEFYADQKLHDADCERKPAEDPHLLPRRSTGPGRTSQEIIIIISIIIIIIIIILLLLF